jgi:diketogulonate reductase-like aldo/keto reductase
MGYRHVDTASVYENHAAIKKGIHGFDRKALFLTSKVALEEIDDAQVEKSLGKACDKALKELGVDYLDLYLLHWPDHSRDMKQIVDALKRLVETGKALHVGVSNFTIHHLRDVLPAKIEANQVEFHPFLYQKKLWEFCKAKQIQLIAYRPLGKGALLHKPLFNEMAQAHGKTASQILLRWLIQKEIPTIPKASSEKHLRENLNIFDFTLSPQEMKKLDSLNISQRYCHPEDPEFNY